MPTLSEAIFQKFLDVNREVNNASEDFVLLVAPKLDPNQGIPPVLIISASSVNKAGNPDDLRKVLGNVVELDVSHNDINDLQEIGVIFQHAPKLKFLNIGFNQLSSATIPLTFPTVDTLNTLILIGTQVPWEIVWFLMRHAKNVTELHLSLNKYAQVELPEQTVVGSENEASLSKVVKLMFDSNPISSWEEISKLGIAFPQLNHLSLTDCPIQVIPTDGGNNFSNLKTLWLSNSRISNLEDFENLKHFPMLADLRVKGIPFLEELNEELRRQHFTALLPNILTLNRGRTISEEDRVTAERTFIRHYLDHEDPPKRFHELKAVHGEVHRLVDVDFKPPTKANILILFEDKEMCRVDVNLKKTVKELKDYLEPVIGLAASKMDLFYFDPGDNYGGKEIMKFPNKKLYTYHLKTNDEIYVYKKGTTVCAYTRFCN